MIILKKIAVLLAIILLPVSLFSVGISLMLRQAFSTPHTIEHALDKSGIYDVFVADALQNMQQDQKDGEVQQNDIPVSQPEVRTIITQAFPATLLRQQTNGMLDSTYAWLNGKTKTWDFRFDLREAKANLANGLATHADQRLAALPVCTGPNLIDASRDPLNATCVPPRFDRAAAVEQVRHQITDGDNFLRDPIITASDLKDKNGHPLNETLQRLPENFQRGKWLPYISVLIVGALSAAIVFWSRGRRIGIRRIGIVAIVVGSFAMLLGWAISIVLASAAENGVRSDLIGDEMNTSIVRFFHILSNSIRGWWIGYGLVLIFLGVGALVTLAVTRNIKPPVQPTELETTKKTEEVVLAKGASSKIKKTHS